MTSNNELRGRIEELEIDLRYRDVQIKELREERRRAVDLVDQMPQPVFVQFHVKGFDPALNEFVGVFDVLAHFDQDKIMDGYEKLNEDHNKLLRQWNKFVGDYNSTVAPRGLGRPLEASEAQVKEVRKLRKTRASLRTIAEQTGLGLRTVRTIVDKDAGTGRIGKRTNLLRKREIDRLRAAEYRSRKRTRDQLPKRITETQKRGEELVKAAKGLDD